MGNALPFSDDFDRNTFQSQWFGSHSPFVAARETGIVGMYKFGSNCPGLGAHVASATYLVSLTAQGRGIGRALVEHSLAQAQEAGCMAMQFNYGEHLCDKGPEVAKVTLLKVVMNSVIALTASGAEVSARASMPLFVPV